jgi:dolichyl-diphosphooligosaccharide--protein glycosyltransferase
MGMYGVLATYFSCVMIRLMLVLAPAVCIISAIAISEILRKASKSIRIWLTQGGEESEASTAEAKKDKTKVEPKEETTPAPKSKKKADKKEPSFIPAQKGKKKKSRLGFDSALMIVIFIVVTLTSYVYHSTMLASEAYSSPSIILSGRRNDGSRYIIDDFREAYYWIK